MAKKQNRMALSKDSFINLINNIDFDYAEFVITKRNDEELVALDFSNKNTTWSTSFKGLKLEASLKQKIRVKGE